MFIESDFYELYSLLNNFSPSERKDQFEDLVAMVFEDLGITGEYVISFDSIDGVIGYFDNINLLISPVQNEFLYKALSFHDMYEIIECYLHEPEHVLQYEEHLKDNSKFEFPEVVLHENGGYVLQETERIAFAKTFAKMQEIINRHLTCTGKELEFYSGMQTYLRERREWFNKAVDYETENFKIRKGVRSIDENDIQEMIHNMKYYGNINSEVLDYRTLRTDFNFVFKFNTNIIEENGMTKGNTCTIYVKDDKMHGSIELPGNFNNTNITFRINPPRLEISNIFGNNADFETLKNLAQSIFKFKNFYKQEFKQELYISNADYCIGEDDIDFNDLKQMYLKHPIEGADVTDVKNIRLTYSNEYFKFNIQRYLNGEIDINRLLDTFETKIKFNRNLISGNEERFTEHLFYLVNSENIKDIATGLSDVKLKAIFNNENLDSLVTKNTILDKIRSFFKKRDDIER